MARRETMAETMYCLPRVPELRPPYISQRMANWLREGLPTTTEGYHAELAELCARNLIMFDGIGDDGEAIYALTPAGLGYVSRRLRANGFHPVTLQDMEAAE